MLRSRHLLLLLTLIALNVFATSPATVNAHPAWGIVVSSTGTVYFSDLETVWQIDRAGKLSVFRQGVSGHHVHELSIDGQDNVYGPITVYDATTQKYLVGVWKMTPAGAATEMQRPMDSVMSGISIWRDSAGNMYSIEQNNNLKQRTLLLKRTPDGRVSTLAGGAYGYADSKGLTAKFSSVTAMTFGPDGDIYLTDGTGVRRVRLDGEVKTIARDVTVRTSDDKPTLFGGNDKSIFGLAVDAGGNVYVADAGNRRLVKIAKDGKLTIVYRVDPPYFPTGVFATANGDVYTLEFSFTPPGTTDQPRVRKISADGQNRIIGVTGRIGFGVVIPRPQSLPGPLQGLVNIVNTPASYIVLLMGAGVIAVMIVLWRNSRRQKT
jgi:hypothetical protein